MKRMQLKHRINICDKKLKVQYRPTTIQSVSMMKSLLQNTGLVNNSSPARRQVTSMNLNALTVRDAFYSFTGSIYSQCTLPPYYTVYVTIIHICMHTHTHTDTGKHTPHTTHHTRHTKDTLSPTHADITGKLSLFTG